VENWFFNALDGDMPQQREQRPLAQLALGVLSFGRVPEPFTAALARVAVSIVAGEGRVVIPENSSLLVSAPFLRALGWEQAPPPSLEYGQFARRPGMHIMAAPTRHAVETITGLGGTGVQVMLAHVDNTPLQGHPMIPLLQFASAGSRAVRFEPDLDALLNPGQEDAASLQNEIIRLVSATASGNYQPRCRIEGNVDFQLTRGLLGVSL
jgi:hypothetical protein